MASGFWVRGYACSERIPPCAWKRHVDIASFSFVTTGMILHRSKVHFFMAIRSIFLRVRFAAAEATNIVAWTRLETGIQSAESSRLRKDH
jgi:hypothetical protein